MSASSALGAPRCDGVAIDGAPDLLPDWALAVRQARNWMPPPASCPAFAIRVEALAHGTVRVVVTSADGRRAERSVGHPADLAPTVLGLVTSIPPEPDVSPPEAGEASRAAPVSPAETPEPRPRRVSVGRAPTEVWLSGAVGARLGEPTHAEMLDSSKRGPTSPSVSGFCWSPFDTRAGSKAALMPTTSRMKRRPSASAPDGTRPWGQPPSTWLWFRPWPP